MSKAYSVQSFGFLMILVFYSKMQNRIFGFRHESQSSAMPAPTIEFGSICLSNAMKLLPKATDIDDAFRQLAASMQEAEGAEKEKE